MKLIGSVRLTNTRHVYKDVETFIVAHVDARGVEHRYEAPASATKRLHELTRGETVTKDTGRTEKGNALEGRKPFILLGTMK
jgi:hypothetical protein